MARMLGRYSVGYCDVYLAVFVSVFHCGFLYRLLHVKIWVLFPVVLVSFQSTFLLCSFMLHRRLAQLSIYSLGNENTGSTKGSR